MNLEPWMPLIIMVATAVLSGIGTIIAAYMKKKYDIDLQVADREALHSAIKTGMESAVAKQGSTIQDVSDINKPEVSKKVVNEALEYASKSVPDALKRLNPPAGILAEIAVSKLSEILKGR